MSKTAEPWICDKCKRESPVLMIHYGERLCFDCYTDRVLKVRR